MKIIDRETARSRGLKRYFTGAPCRRGHVCERQTSNTACIECHRQGAQESYTNNRDTALAQKREYRSRSDVRDRAKTYGAMYYERNRDKFSAHNAAYYQRNAAAIAERMRSDAGKRPDVYAERYGRRRAQKLNATPPWLTVEQRIQMLGLYRRARTLTKLTGTKHHVDHIVPLRGKLVCGLHVPWNLQVIPARENMSKSNKVTS